MDNKSQVSDFDPAATARFHAQELIQALSLEYPTVEAFIEALAQVRAALLEALDAADPAQVVEDARQRATPNGVSRRFADESEQRRKDRGSIQDPLYPPTTPKSWD